MSIESLTDSGRTTPTTLSGRPVLRASFAADYAIGGLHVEVYHVTNLLIHLAMRGDFVWHRTAESFFGANLGKSVREIRPLACRSGGGGLAGASAEY